MTDQTKATRRDEVLFAFHRECAIPTLNQIINWTQRYPEFADDIRAHAGIMRDWAANEETEEVVVDELMMNRARSRALNAIYNAQAHEFAGQAGKAIKYRFGEFDHIALGQVL